MRCRVVPSMMHEVVVNHFGKLLATPSEVPFANSGGDVQI